VQADQILSAWTPAKGLLRGTLSTDLTFSGAGQAPEDVKRTLTLVGLAALSEGQLGPGPALQAIADLVKVPQMKELKFKDLKVPMRVEHGRLITDAVHMTGPSGEWNLSGAMGLDGALDYAVSVTLPPEAAATLNAKSALAAGALTDEKGRMLLDLRVGGTARSPKVAWDTRAMRDRLAGRASQAMTEQRDKLEAEARAAALLELKRRLGVADSTGKAPGPTMGAIKDSLRKSGGSALDKFLGGFGKKPTPPPVPPPAPPPVPPPADTSGH
jgi:hypothetical protein